MSKFSFGSDPEFMLKNGDRYVSAIEVVLGDIANRITVRGHQFYWDNVLAECAINFGRHKTEVIDNFRDCLGIYAEMVHPHVLVAQASQEYPPEALQDERSQIVGCKPDTCAYMMEVATPPRDKMCGKPLRSCGGHIHLGQEEGILDGDGCEPVIIVHLLDLFLSIPAMFIEKDPTSAARRSLYGQAGRYRPKPYGIEYRSLGNFWLASPKLVELVYDICDFTISFVETGHWKQLWSFDEELYWELNADYDSEDPARQSTAPAFQCKLYDKWRLKECIDTYNRTAAKRFMKLVEDYVPSKLFGRIEKAARRKKSYDMYKEWGIGE